MDFRNAAEIEFRIALLPPISRGAHLAGPRLHAERLTALWKADGPVPLGEAFRLLDMDAVAGVILRTVTANEYEGDPRHWQPPPFGDLLPELRETVWQDALAGRLVLEAIKGVTGQRYQPLVPALLPRLTPDWELSRLMRDGRDEYIKVRVCPMPATDIPRPWQEKPSSNAIAVAAKKIAEAYPPPDARLSFAKFWTELDARVGTHVTREQALAALEKHAPHLRGRRGYKSPG